MIDNPIQTLRRDIDQYLQWMISTGYSFSTCGTYRTELNKFTLFIIRKQIGCNDIFTPNTLKEFQKDSPTATGPAVRGLWQYLFDQKRIHQQIDRPYRRLPDPYEDYLLYYHQTREVSFIKLGRIRRVLCAFHDYLERQNLKLASIRIEHIDAFLAEFFTPFSPVTRHTYRSYLRGFLKFLFYPRKILRKDLSPMVVGARQYAQSKPPKFFRAHEIQRLFDSFDLSSFKNIRNYAMLRLSFDLGLRPDEISLITLDDISFTQSELTLATRKNDRPAKLPLPEDTIKAITAYVIGARPKSSHRRLFLNLVAPYRPISAQSVGQHITECIRKAGLSGTAYWLRHTYAQNLLEAGSSIYEIKEMMGHSNINSSEKYLHVHIELMRRVIFNEKLSKLSGSPTQ
jgi:integrase/recombinase XerD